MIERKELHAGENDRRKRLEDLLFERFPGLSRMYLRELVRDLKCEVNGEFENIGRRLRPGDFIEIELDLSRENAMQPEPMPLSIVFEDEYLVIVDKPAGMLVHPTHRDKKGTLLNALAHHLNAAPRNGDVMIRPGLVHRLDKDTSGLIVVAKDVRTHRILAKAFQRKQVGKKYVARIAGKMNPPEGTIDIPIGRYHERKVWDTMPDGKAASTKYRRLRLFDDSTLVELEPVTGRTNQLRIHCAAVGYPIVGDTARGGPPYVRLCLHASAISFRHPATGETVRLVSPVPSDISDPEFSGSAA